MSDTIDEIRAMIQKLLKESLGQEESDLPPEQQSAKNIENLVKNAPPGMLMEELKELSKDPDVQDMVK